jgi:FkbM family methyltransferase
MNNSQHKTTHTTKIKKYKNKTNKINSKRTKKSKVLSSIKINKPKILYNTKYLVKQEKQLMCLLGKSNCNCNHDESIKTEVKHCISFLSNMPKMPKIFIDIGAHKGLYTKEVLKFFPDIECYLFEPSPSNTIILKNKFENLNNVHISKHALSNITGKQKIYFDKPGSEITSLTKRRLEHFHMYMDYSEEIETTRFDEFWKTTDTYLNNPNTIIDYVKIDVEGHELDVLEGFGSLIKNMGLIQFEFGGTNIDTRTFFQDFWYFFNNKLYDFSIYRIASNGLIPITHYSETDEYFQTTNYIAINNKINKTIKETNNNLIKVFTEVYETNKWGDNDNPKYEGSSGFGSALEYNEKTYIPFMHKFFKEYKIKSVVDLGCGDFRIGLLLYDKTNIDYTGYDAYKGVIDYNNDKFKEYTNFHFIHSDFTSVQARQNINNADLCIIKDVLQHLPNKIVIKFLDYITKSNKFKYILLINSCVSRYSIKDINPGDFRPLSALYHPLKKYNAKVLYKWDIKFGIHFDRKEISLITL